MKTKTVGWFSGGASSFVSIYLSRDIVDEVFFIDIADHHPDTYRFLKDCERALGMPIKRLQHKNLKLLGKLLEKLVTSMAQQERVVQMSLKRKCVKSGKKSKTLIY